VKQFSKIAIDLSKGAFQFHGVDAEDNVVLQRTLKRGQVIAFFAKLPPCLVGMEACASAHYWAREIEALGHRVVLVPPAYVKPFVKRGRKNDANDAAAICTAMSSKAMTFVPIKTPDQQALLVLHRTRSALIKQRTMLANSLRGQFAEFGIIEPCGEMGLGKLIALAVDAPAQTPVPRMALEALAMQASLLRDTETRIKALDEQIKAAHQACDDSKRLATIPRIGPIIASAMVASIGDAKRFKSGRDFAAWLGLVPSQHSTGGKTVLGPITKAGDRYLRSLLVLGATGMLRGNNQGPWVKALLARMEPRKATIAIANKLARIIWAILAHGGEYRKHPAFAA